MFARELASGNSGLEVSAMLGTISATLTAAGTTQATATAITSVTTNITSGSSGNGVLLPGSMNPGDSGVICNTLTADIFVYPTSGGTINGASANTPLLLASQKAARFVYVTPSNVIITA